MLEDAIALHAQGRLAEAEEAYRAILENDPDNAPMPATGSASWHWMRA